MPNFEIAITPSFFLLERRSKSQNARNALGYLVDITYFRNHVWRKRSPRSHNFVTFQKFHLFNETPIRHQKWIDHMHITHERYFHADDVTDEVTAWRHIRLLYSRENREFVFISIVQFIMSANSRTRFVLQIVLVCLYITPSHNHHCANFIWRHWTYKMPVRYNLSSVWVRLSIYSQLSIIQYSETCL